MLAAEILFERFRTARLVVRGLALLKGLGPYAAIEILLPGGSLIAIGLWLYARHKAGKPLLPFRSRAGAPATQETGAAEALFSGSTATQEAGETLFSRPAIEGFFRLRSEAGARL